MFAMKYFLFEAIALEIIKRYTSYSISLDLLGNWTGFILVFGLAESGMVRGEETN